MGFSEGMTDIEELKRAYPEKFPPIERAFGSIHAGDSIFIGTGCGQPQYLVRSLLEYVRSHPKAFFDTEILQVWNLGVTACTDERMKDYFRYNSFFIGQNMRGAVNSGAADYTPIFLSAVPDLFKKEVSACPCCPSADVAA